MQLLRTTFDTPLGTMEAVASEKGICRVDFLTDSRYEGNLRRLSYAFGPIEIVDSENDILAKCRDWFSQYFSQKSSPKEIPLDLRSTEFEVAVWNALLHIPLGKTITYGQLASQVGCTSARAVGTAVGKNPINIIVPCHRVIGADGSLTGYGGGLPRKRWLLENEGALSPALAL